MSQQSDFKNRATRVARSFVVRINANPSAAKPRWDIVTAKDISASGILFNYGQYLEPGSRVQFRISLPICGSVDCEGEVVRNVLGTSRGLVNSGPTVCAVAAVFRNISEKDQKAMHEFFGQIDAETGGDAGTRPLAKDRNDHVPRAKRIDHQFMTRIQKPAGDKWEIVPVHNISSSGIFFNYPEALTADSELSLRITLPFVESPVECRGTVVRVEKRSRPGATVPVYGIGAVFSGLDETARRQVDEYAGKFGRD